MGHDGGADWSNMTISVLVLSSMDYPTDCCPHWSGAQRKGLHTQKKVGPEKVIHCGMRFSPTLGVPAPHPGLQGRKEFNLNNGSSIVVEQIIELEKNLVHQVSASFCPPITYQAGVTLNLTMA